MNGITADIKDLGIAPKAGGAYVPPALRNRPQGQTPPAGMYSDSKTKPSFRSESAASFSSFSKSERPDNRGQNDSRGGYAKGAQGYGAIKGPPKDPSDEFYARKDVKGRNQRTELLLFGAQHNSGINFGRYDDIPVEVSGREATAPIENFQTSDMDPLAKSNVLLAGYTNATPVQKYAVSIVTAGRDLMACAQTGSGKVLSYLT